MYSVCKTFSDVFLDSFSTTLEVACYIHKDKKKKKIHKDKQINTAAISLHDANFLLFSHYPCSISGSIESSMNVPRTSSPLFWRLLSMRPTNAARRSVM